MKDFSRLLTILCILGAGSIPRFCNATTTTTTSGRNASVRNEFVLAMDQAMGKKKNDETFRKRLGQLAIPASSHPGYMRSQQHEQILSSTEENNRHLEEYQDYGIDLTEYALKYIGCSNIRTWSDDLAAEGNNNNNGYTDSVLKMDKFVVLRLCPRDSCSNYNQMGCQEQFGDYLIPMETYLQTMAETYFTQYQEYCEYCYECMAYVNNNGEGNSNNYYNNAADDGNYYSNGDDGNYNNGDDGGRRLNDDATYNYYSSYAYGADDAAADDAAADDAAADDAAGGGDDDNNNQYYYNGNQNANQGESCEYYAVCAGYQTACQEYSNLGFDLEDYFECAEFNIGNSAGYLGPHCASDGKTISMGIFNDEYCNDYKADLSEVSSYMAVNDNDLQAYYSNNCISCLASDGYTLEAANDDDSYTAVSDICGALYGEGAKCNKYMGNDGNIASANQESQEDTVCNFIQNLLTNSYNEYGEIVLNEVGWKSYIPDVREVSRMAQWQKYVLSVSILASVSMYVYAAFLYRQIKERKYTWYPRGRKGYSTGYPGDPTSMDGRLNSGILQGRSHSSGHFEMKNGGLLS